MIKINNILMENLIEEQNIIKKDWRKIKLSFALVYPNIYRLGMSSYAIHLLYSLLNSRDDTVCERYFLPENIKYPASQDNTVKIGRIFSMENQIALKEFDVLGFSIQFENDYKNLLWIIEAAGIPLRTMDRIKISQDQGQIYPLVIAGGPCATSNAMVLSEYVDLFFIGDVEPSINEFLDLATESKEKFSNLNHNLELFQKIHNIFIPSKKNECKRAVLKSLDESTTPIPQIRAIFNDPILKVKKGKKEKGLAFGDTFLLEINRGCPFSCKFCISCHHNSPFRNRTFENIIKTINHATELQEIRKIAFIGSSVTSHPKFKEICKFLNKRKINFMIPSIRIDTITSELLQILEQGDIRTLTIAPETGYENLRYAIGKKISNEQIINAVKIIKDSNIRNIKFYFLVGLPGEWDDDVNAIVDLMIDISNLGFEKNSLKVNINPFIPKLNTPFQIYVDYFSKLNIKDLKNKLERIKNRLYKLPPIKLKIKNIKRIINEALIQTIFSVGDEKVSKLLYDYYYEGATLSALKKAAKKVSFSFDTYFEKIKEGFKPLPPSCSI